MASGSKLSKEGIGFILCNCLSKIVDLFVSTFLVAYLLNLSDGNFFQVSLYYTFLYLGMTVFYTIASKYLHKINKLVFYRISIVLKCIFIIMIGLLKENIVDYIIPISIFYSIEASLYWSSYNAMMSEAISSKNIQKFYGVYNIYGYIISIVAPLVLGSVIDAGSFIKTSIYAFIVCLLLFFSTLLLVNRKEEGNDLAMKEFFEGMKENSENFKACYLMCFFNGVRSSLGTIITILIVLTFNSNMSLGSLSSIMSCIAIVVTFFFTKFYNSKFSKIIFLCFVLCMGGLVGTILEINKVTIVLFNVLYTIAMIIPDNLYSQRRMGLARVTDKHKFILEHNVMCEFSLNVGRFISYTILVIASFSTSIGIYKILLIVNAITIAMYCIGMYFLEKRYSGILSKNDTLAHLKEVEEDCANYYHYKGELKKEITK